MFDFISKKTQATAGLILLVVIVGCRTLPSPRAVPELLPQTNPVRSYHGVITTSFLASAQHAGVAVELARAFVNIFAARLDIVRAAQYGDRWRFITTAREGIVAAEYEAHGRSILQAVRYVVGGRAEYYAPQDGGSLRYITLPSPVKRGRLTRRLFSRRPTLHPFLKVMRPHYGVDYLAPAGTEVLSVADGKVVRANRTIANGWNVKLAHHPYHSAYCHLQRIAAKVVRGSRVKRGQVIGYVGSTGWATGAHLHFALYKNRRYINPLSKKLRAYVPLRLRSAFKQHARVWLARLPRYPTGSSTQQRADFRLRLPQSLAVRQVLTLR